MGWLTDPGDFLLYLRPFLSFNLNDLTSSLGLIFLIMLINFKLQKQTKYLPLILIILILATGQILQDTILKLFFYYPIFINQKNLL